MKKRMTRWMLAKMPTRDAMERNRWLAPIAHRFGRSELWRFTRRSVPRGVALGVFAGFIIPVGQIFLAAFLALPARANVPVAALITFITNPFTLPFWLFVANKVGKFVLMIDAATGGTGRVELEDSWWSRFGWFLQTAGVTSFGFIVLSLVGSALAYLGAALAWRLLVARRWNRRLRRSTTLDPAK